MFGSIESAREAIGKLVERYRANRDRYQAASYNEETARGEFISPLFNALGWDVYNAGGLAEQYKDVIHEEGIKIGDFTKAPDYTFRVGGVRKFFVEAKKPFVDLRTDPAPAYQLRRYAWSAKLPLSILTDFEELAVYDTRIRPNYKGPRVEVYCSAFIGSIKSARSGLLDAIQPRGQPKSMCRVTCSNFAGA